MALALVLLFLPNTYREGIARGVRATILRPVLAMQRGAVERQAFFEDASQLRAERDSLAAFLVGNANVTAENRQLRELLGLRERLAPSFVPAEIVRIPGRASEGYFQLTAGAQHGVVAGASIVAAQGLVGRVREVDGAISFGIDWMHQEFRASAMTLDGEIYGIVEPRRVDGEPVLVLTGTPRHVELEANAVIVTSGHGGVFPRGIPIGLVVGPEGGEQGWQRNYVIRPLVSPAEMTYVLVLGEPQSSLAGRDLALVWGIRPADAAPVPVQGELAPASTGPAGQSAPGAQSSPGGTAPAPAPATPDPTPEPVTPDPDPAPPQVVTPAPQGPPLLGVPTLPGAQE